MTSRGGADQVTVIIPTYNRAASVSRAVVSALRQTHPPLEVLVVDDGSTDDSHAVVTGIADSRVVYLRHAARTNAAAARNRGLDAASGNFVAFLDSDDEWAPEHLARKLALLHESAADGAFGPFRLLRAGCPVKRRFDSWPKGMPLIEYILSGRGDARTSTFVFTAEAIRRVRFDAELRKHQDWDLASRFDQAAAMVKDGHSTAVLHESGPLRMTTTLDHVATERFYSRHCHLLSEATQARFNSLMALRTLKMEGRSAAMGGYLQRARQQRRAASLQVRWLIRGLSLPVVAPLLGLAHDAYLVRHARRHALGSKVSSESAASRPGLAESSW